MPVCPAPNTTHPDLSDLWEVAVALPLAHTLTYRAPPGLTAAAQVGSLVRVPVGRRQVTGYLLGPTYKTPPGTLRDIGEVLDPIPRFGSEMVDLFRWVADYYQYPLGEALSFIIPGGGPGRQPAPGTLGLPHRTSGCRGRATASGPQIPGAPGFPQGNRPHPGKRS